VRKWSVNIRLFFVFGILLTGFLIIRYGFIKSSPLQWRLEMADAADLARNAFLCVENRKEHLGIQTDAVTSIPYPHLLGSDYTFMTTTLGSQQAKELSTNPDFAALLVRYLMEAGLNEGDHAGLIISGSFPALAISTLAAMRTLHIEPIIISSLGASSYGANQPEATWIDIENWLLEDGFISSRTMLLSPGAENDRGDGLIDEGLEMLKEAARRNRYSLYLPENLKESIKRKVDLLMSEEIRVLVNIGGNQSAVGGCPHASILPNGLSVELPICNHPDRGILQEINSRGIPVVHLLNIRDLAYRFGMDLSPGLSFTPSTRLYDHTSVSPVAVSLSLLPGLAAFFVFFPIRQRNKR
jgi:poly-gamma-glutamate system protein